MAEQQSPPSSPRLSLPSSVRRATVTSLGPRSQLGSFSPPSNTKNPSRPSSPPLSSRPDSPHYASTSSRHVPNVLPNPGFFSPRKPPQAHTVSASQPTPGTTASSHRPYSPDSLVIAAPQTTPLSRESTSDGTELQIHARTGNSEDSFQPTPPSSESHTALTTQQARYVPSREPLLDPSSSSNKLQPVLGEQQMRHRSSYPDSKDDASSGNNHSPRTSTTVRKMRDSLQGSRDGRVRSDFIDLTSPDATATAEREDYEWAAEAKSHQVIQVDGEGWTGKGTVVLDEKGRPTRRYRLHPGSNRFFLRGRILTSRDSIWTFVGTLAVVLFLPIGFLIFNADWLWNEYASSSGKAVIIVFAYITLMAWANMLKTSWSDPGILPRGLHEPDTELIACAPGSPEDMGNGMAERAKARYIRVREDIVTSKWCETCETYRPPRTSHCRLCNNCVEKTDHHCSWLNNCVGAKNYLPFFVFVTASIIGIIFIIAFSIIHLTQLHRNGSNPFKTWQEIGSLIVIILSAGVGSPLIGLFAYHVRLVWLGHTTIEMLRPKADQQQARSIFSMRSPWTNFAVTLCKPDAPSYLMLYKRARQDQRQENPSNH